MATGNRVEGRVAFITGAARGQGRSHAVRLAGEGADIIAVDICGQLDSVPYPMAAPEDLAETVRQVEALDRRIVGLQADVRDRDALGAALATGVSQLGRLDIVVANAGIWNGAPAVDLPVNAWQDMIDINLTGVWNACQVSLQHLIDGGRGGSMILTSSTMGIRGGANITGYAAAKHGVVGVMRSLAIEVAPHFIRVNSIHPTAVATPMIHNEAMYQLFRPDLEHPTVDDARDTFQALNLLPIPWVEMSDISNAVLFLASDESRYITGVSLPVDAGATQK
jgi:(+)-trans-carveol dehydrogenase